jgi:hypothetical protein
VRKETPIYRIEKASSYLYTTVIELSLKGDWSTMVGHTLITQLSSMTISDIIQKHPETLKIFDHYGLPTEGVTAQQWEWVTATCRVHQLNSDKVLSELSHCISTQG